MKTDRFADSIRRKLESIRPDFTDKDWTRMQSALHQAILPHPGPSVTGGGSMWAGHPWLLAAATVSTAVLMAVSVWQWQEITSLRRTTEQLKQQNQATQTTPQPEAPALTGTGSLQKPETSQNAPVAPVHEQVATRQRDTVYITRRVVVPRLTEVETSKERSAQRTESPPEPRFTDETNKPILADELRSTENKNINNNPGADGTSATPSIEKSSASLPAVNDNNRNETIGKKAKNKPLSTSEKRVADLNLPGSGSTSDLARGLRKGQRPPVSYNPVTDAPASTLQKLSASENVRPETTSGQSELPAEIKKVTTAVEQLTSLTLSTDPGNWQAALTKRARKIRQTQPAVAVAPAPEKAPASRPVQVTSHFRVGVGGAVSSEIWSAGVFTELLVGRHLTLGIGLSKATHTNTYINDFDFESRTRRDFRREFARGIDPKRDILNIETRVTRLQLPVSLGYRIPLSHSFTLTPSVSTNLNLSSGEAIAFYLPIAGPQRGFDKGTLIFDRSVNLMTNFQLVPSLEWQRGHWVMQGGPVFTIPLHTQQSPAQAIPGWPQTVLGMRTRLLYQF